MNARTIDITPTWSEILAALHSELHVLHIAEARRIAEVELKRMAKLADRHMAQLKAGN